MNKYRGSNFEDYLKEKGIFEEVSACSKKRWEALRAEASVVTEDTTIVASKNNETHFERRARGPRPYEQSSVKGKVSD